MDALADVSHGPVECLDGAAHVTPHLPDEVHDLFLQSCRGLRLLDHPLAYLQDE